MATINERPRYFETSISNNSTINLPHLLPRKHSPFTPPPPTLPKMALLVPLTVSIVAFIHVYISILEMFLWTTPRGLKSFGLTPAFALETKVLAANQGLYNGFLASGLVWGVLHPTQEFGQQIQLFFLLCVAVAGIFGAVTTGKGKIFFVQSVPAAGAIFMLCFV